MTVLRSNLSVALLLGGLAALFVTDRFVVSLSPTFVIVVLLVLLGAAQLVRGRNR